MQLHHYCSTFLDEQLPITLGLFLATVVPGFLNWDSKKWEFGDTMYVRIKVHSISTEGSAPRAVAASWAAMACADNAIPGRVPQPKNPVIGPGEDSGRPNLSLAWFTVSPCVRGLNKQPSDCYDN